jgi:retron-type reverse transcriptase
MPQRHDHLFEGIANFQALEAAARRAVKGKRSKPGAARFMLNLERELLRLERELWEGNYRTGTYLELLVHDPKQRVVSAAPFRDRVVHHALFAVIGPIFERGFIADSFANRSGFGTHRAVARYEQLRDRHAQVLRADIWRYFPSIDHEVLKRDLRRRLACPRTLELCDRIIDGSNPQEPAEAYFPGDDLFEPSRRRRGLPLGNLTSQFFANVYLNGLDHWVKELLRAPYLRYVDDFALFSNSAGQLQEWRNRIESYLVGRRLLLHPAKTWVAPSLEPATFLGYELHANGRRHLAQANVDRFRLRLSGMRRDWAAGRLTDEDIRRRIGGWTAHARHAHSRGLRHQLFKGGWFDPQWSDGSPVEAPGALRSAASCGVARGTTTRGTCVRPTATGTRPATGTTTPVSVWPAPPLPEHLPCSV